jgi:saccharopine dehydrogenase-like NADP-dependent oxidoreductase
MKTIVVLGAGKIGRMVGHFLSHSGDYTVRLGDVDLESARAVADRIGARASAQACDFSSASDLDSILDQAWAVVSCAPFHCNPLIAERAKAAKVHYFDLTEDVAVTQKVKELAEGAESAFIPQCGLAPGFITIVAVHLLEGMTDVQDLRMRVGALPRYPSNRLKYNMTWSTAGVINEYCQPCEVIRDHELTSVPPMEHLETLTIDGVRYEAFNTSGGLGTLANTLVGKVRNCDYKSMRFPGHNELMKFLLDDLRMADDQKKLGEIFDRCLPTTLQDQIVIFVSAAGTYDGRFTERTFATTIYHQEIDGQDWTGIQITTAAGVCAVVDLLAQGKLADKGFVRQEDVRYEDFIKNRFGRYYE